MQFISPSSWGLKAEEILIASSLFIHKSYLYLDIKTESYRLKALRWKDGVGDRLSPMATFDLPKRDTRLNR